MASSNITEIVAMFQEIEIPAIQANIIAIVLPIILVCLIFLITPTLSDGSSSRFRRYLSYLVKPPELESSTENSSRSDRVRIFFYYIGIVLFLTSFLIGEFYEVILDLILPVTQGSTGAIREVTSIIFQSPFNAGWYGSLPWMGLDAYHETWNWIYFTAGLTDNPGFLSQINQTLILFSIGVGVVFLIPLGIRRIRQSFMPSLFFFMSGMAVFSKAAISSLAYAIALAYGGVELQYSSIITTGSMIPGLSEFIVVLFLLVVGMFVLFTILGRFLWKVHFPDSGSRNWFTIYTTLSFWLVLVLTILVV